MEFLFFFFCFVTFFSICWTERLSAGKYVLSMYIQQTPNNTHLTYTQDFCLKTTANIPHMHHIGPMHSLFAPNLLWWFHWVRWLWIGGSVDRWRWVGCICRFGRLVVRRSQCIAKKHFYSYPYLVSIRTILLTYVICEIYSECGSALETVNDWLLFGWDVPYNTIDQLL